MGVHDVLTLRQVFELEVTGVQPILIRQLVSQRRFDLIVFDDAVLNGVDQEHASGLQTTLTNNAGWVNGQHSGFTGQNH
ncbi:unannotated protein [freshwater metagenome]|uniref:Unannotated protein n=1 Tax=freshwater metagenome TaxID=449393 RepID=A0A6J6IMQ0_9ZZZZ